MRNKFVVHFTDMPPNPSSAPNNFLNQEVSIATEKAKLLTLRQRIIDEDIKHDNPERVTIETEIVRLESFLDNAATQNNMSKHVANDAKYNVSGTEIYKWDTPTGDGDPDKSGASDFTLQSFGGNKGTSEGNPVHHSKIFDMQMGRNVAGIEPDNFSNDGFKDTVFDKENTDKQA
jgi:hypothetical protein